MHSRTFGDLCLLAKSYRKQGKYESASQCCLEAEEMLENVEDCTEKPRFYQEYGILCVEMDNSEKGKRYLERSEALAHEASTEGLDILNCKYLAQLHTRNGQLDQAFQYGQRSYEIATRLGVNIEIPGICEVLSEIHQRSDDLPKAEEYRRKAEEIKAGWGLEKIAEMQMPDLPF